MEIVFLNPIDIKVKDGLARFRTDLGDIEALADSFKRLKQILPIVVNRNNELIDGGRRLAACMMAGINVKAVYEDAVDPFEMRELELEANLHRKDFTPAEEALAIQEMHFLKQKKFGKSCSGSDDGWSINDTANLLGKSRGSVYNALEDANIIKAFPQLQNAKKKSEIRKAGKSLLKLSDAMSGLKKHEEAISKGAQTFQLFQADAVEHMIAMPSDSIDILLTDPLYGIEADSITSGIGGNMGGITCAGYSIRDSKEPALYFYEVLSKESFRFTKENSHGFIFSAPEHFYTIRQMFIDSGWLAYIRPVIWIKRETGQCNVPSAWPASCYEMILYIRKQSSRLVKEGQADWMECPPVNPSERLHPYEKPVPVLLNLLERVALPGHKLYDPFMGSASSIEAALKLRMFPIGVDNSLEAYSNACKRMALLEGGKK